MGFCGFARPLCPKRSKKRAENYIERPTRLGRYLFLVVSQRCNDAWCALRNYDPARLRKAARFDYPDDHQQRSQAVRITTARKEGASLARRLDRTFGQFDRRVAPLDGVVDLNSHNGVLLLERNARSHCILGGLELRLEFSVHQQDVACNRPGVRGRLADDARVNGHGFIIIFQFYQLKIPCLGNPI